MTPSGKPKATPRLKRATSPSAAPTVAALLQTVRELLEDQKTIKAELRALNSLLKALTG